MQQLLNFLKTKINAKKKITNKVFFKTFYYNCFFFKFMINKKIKSFRVLGGNLWILYFCPF